MNENTCIGCMFYGKAGDAPETVELDCMWRTPSAIDGWEPPCMRTSEGDSNDEL